MREIKSLTGLRGYAALWVCLHHYHYGDYSGKLSYYLKLAKQGSWGVIIFFVLSGFIMAYVYQSWFRDGWNRREYSHFMFIRFARVYPLHLLTLLLWFGFCIIGFIGYNQNDTPYTFLLNVFLIHAWGFTDLLSWNQPSWSISMEFFCYIFFPLGVAYVRKLTCLGWIVGICGTFIMLYYSPHVILADAVMDYFGADLGVYRFSYGLTLISWVMQFVLGVIVFQLISYLKAGQILLNCAVLSALLIIGYMIAFEGILPSRATIPVIALAATIMIYGLYHGAYFGELIFGNPVSVFLGAVSYGLYLSHIMTPLVIDQIFIHLGSLQRMTEWPMIYQVMIALLVASLLHYGFEKPTRHWIRSRWGTLVGGEA